MFIPKPTFSEALKIMTNGKIKTQVFGRRPEKNEQTDRNTNTDELSHELTLKCETHFLPTNDWVILLAV